MNTFRKILVANRGEIAVRIMRACRELGIACVALYEISDRTSLHVRMADECVLLESEQGFFDRARVLQIAQAVGADAIHPGYGYLAEKADFVTLCAQAGIVVIGPSAPAIARAMDNVGLLETVAAGGIQTLPHSTRSFGVGEDAALSAAAAEVGYPLTLKSAVGGRGPGQRRVNNADELARAIDRASAESASYYGDGRLYVEGAIDGAHEVGVQVVADRFGHIIQLGEREGSIAMRNRKLVEEAPAPCIEEESRRGMHAAAIAIARLIGYDNVGTVEFQVDGYGNFYFTEFKARIQVEHTLTEMLTGVDLVQTQIHLAAGRPLDLRQDQVVPRGWAMMTRIRAQNPWAEFMSTPGTLTRARFPSGPGLRVDTYVYCGAVVPGTYNALFAKLTVWAEDRPACVDRLRYALADTKIVGTTTNIPALQSVVMSPQFVDGCYTSDFMAHPYTQGEVPPTYYRDLAAVAAILYLRHGQLFTPSLPERYDSGWHRSSRQLPA